MVVLALPLDRLLAPDPTLVDALPAAAVVTDVGSVKASVVACWGPRLGGRFVASHPMAGTVHAGVEAGQLDLFRGRPWVATPDATTAAPALVAVRELAEALGAHWLTCEAAAHDRAVALISHLPVLVSAALLQTADRATAAAPPLASLVRALASSGFADTSRVGGGNPELGALMARCNQGALLAALERYREAITDLETLVRAGEWDVLQQELATCQQLRPSFL
jgi:arogenate dehydrogenase (NADP+)